MDELVKVNFRHCRLKYRVWMLYKFLLSSFRNLKEDVFTVRRARENSIIVLVNFLAVFSCVKGLFTF